MAKAWNCIGVTAGHVPVLEGNWHHAGRGSVTWRIASGRRDRVARATAPSASLANGGCPIRTSKYETSSNCRSLSEIAKRYVAAGGLKQSAPCTADRIAEGAHAKAWMALAISKTGDPNLMIW